MKMFVSVIVHLTFISLVFMMPKPEDLFFNTFMTDTAQNPDEQSQSEMEILDGDIYPEVETVRGDDGVEVERIVQKNDTNEDGSDNEQWDNTRPMLSHWDFHVIPYRVILLRTFEDSNLSCLRLIGKVSTRTTSPG